MQIATTLGARVVTDPADVGPHGADVVLELLGGNHVAEDLSIIGSGGRIIVVSVAAGSRVPLDVLRLMTKRATIRGTVLRARSLGEKAEAVEAFAKEVVPLLISGSVRPAIDSVWAMADIHRAFDRLGQRGKRGKVLLAVADEHSNEITRDAV